jgi:hypothetical protein
LAIRQLLLLLLKIRRTVGLIENNLEHVCFPVFDNMFSFKAHCRFALRGRP